MLPRYARIAGVGATAALLSASVDTDRPPSGAGLDLFTISKSENRNQVQYVIDVDPRCAPAPGEPVRAYWRMLERGPNETAPLLDREQPAYGLASQSVSERTGEGGRARITLRALPSRGIEIETLRSPSGGCEARSMATIDGETASLFDVYVKLRWPAGVSYLLLRGWAFGGSRIVTEQIEP